MREYEAYGDNHIVYESRDEVPQSTEVLENWRDGEVGDWVLADDGCVIQILRKDKVSIGTCTGKYGIADYHTMETNRNNDIHQIGGENWYTTLLYRETATKKEVLFAKCVAGGMEEMKAYMQSFGTKNKKYARRRATILMKTERINKIVTEEKKDVFEELDIDFKYCISRAKHIADNAKNEGDQIRALNMIWSAFGVVEEPTKTTSVGVIQQISTKELESAQRQLKE
jgi:hypothetical protein